MTPAVSTETLDPPASQRASGSSFYMAMRILPQAIPDDGWLDVLIMKDLSRAEIYANIWKVYQGTHLFHPKMETCRARRVLVTSPARILLEIDGECAGQAPAEFTLLPQILSVCVPTPSPNSAG